MIFADRLQILALGALLVAAASGCASSKPVSTETVSITSTRFAEDGGNAIAASALVFDPPVTLNEPHLELSREDRGPAAFFGYDEGSIEYYRLTVDDRQIGYGGIGHGGRGGGRWGGGGGWAWSDRYERRAYSERVGAIRR